MHHDHFVLALLKDEVCTVADPHCTQRTRLEGWLGEPEQLALQVLARLFYSLHHVRMILVLLCPIKYEIGQWSW